MRTDNNDARARLLSLMLAQDPEHAIILLDAEGEIVDWLAGASTVFGYSAEEVRGRPHAMLFTPEDVADGVPAGELIIARSGAPAEDDRWMLRKDGIRVWATGVLFALRDDESRIVGFGKILRNRTDLKGQLESLTNRIESLESSQTNKNKFISTMSHELRTPLSAVANSVPLLRRLLPSSEESTFLSDMLERQVGAMRRLIDDLLDVTRIHAGKISLDLREESLEEILRSAVETCRPLVEDRTHRLHLLLASSPVTVRADATRLQQVFVNLIENAIKYTEYGGEIWIKLLVEGREALVKIEDNGVGISPEILPHIFDMFTQAEFVGEKTDGLGIGLSVVKDLTALHGGSVQVRSDGLGRGSEFIVRLPVAAEDRPDSPAPA